MLVLQTDNYDSETVDLAMPAGAQEQNFYTMLPLTCSFAETSHA